jgi:hypothetical protein
MSSSKGRHTATMPTITIIPSTFSFLSSPSPRCRSQITSTRRLPPPAVELPTARTRGEAKLACGGTGPRRRTPVTAQRGRRSRSRAVAGAPFATVASKEQGWRTEEGGTGVARRSGGEWLEEQWRRRVARGRRRGRAVWSKKA